MPVLALILVAVSLAPFAFYLALKRPLIFPLGLYIVLIPFDALLGATLTITRLVAIACGAALVFHMLSTRRVLAPPKSWAPWAAFVLLASLTALWSLDPTRTFLWIGQILQLFLFFTILAIYPADRKDVRAVGAIVVLSGIGMSLLGLLSYLQGFRTQEDRLSISFNGMLLDPNHIAATLLLPIALAVGALLETRDTRIRLAALLSLIPMTATLFLTGSRGGLIALATMLIYLAWRTRYRLQILGLLATAGLGSLLVPTVWTRFADKGLEGGSGRAFIWDVGKFALKEYWFKGCGFGAFQSAYNLAFLSIYQPLFQGWSRPAHNAILSAAVEMGLLGAGLLVYAWWRSWCDARGNVVIEAALVGLATAALFLDVILFKYIWLAFSMAVLVKNVAEPRFLRGGARRQEVVKRPTILANRRFWQRAPIMMNKDAEVISTSA